MDYPITCTWCEDWAAGLDPDQCPTHGCAHPPFHDICGKAIECLLCMVNIAKPDAAFCSGDCDLPIQLDGPFAGFKVIYL